MNRIIGPGESDRLLKYDPMIAIRKIIQKQENPKDQMVAFYILKKRKNAIDIPIRLNDNIHLNYK